MKKEKKQLSQQEIFRKELRKSKLFEKLSPIVFFTFILLSIIFAYLTLKNSVGNIKEIFYMLDKNIFNGEQLEENYAFLIQKYGEWEIIGGKGGSFGVRFINIKRAIFGGVMIGYFALTIICFVIAVGVGHILFPLLAKYYKESKDYMVDIATLETAEMLKAEKKKKKKDKEEEWF